MKEKRISLRQSNKGFTLVEIVVVFVIFSILATTATLGLISWQTYAINNKQDEYAEMIFMAAKNQVTARIANGVLEEDSFWAKSNATVPGSADNTYYMMCKKGDYKKYRKNQNIPENTKLFFNFIDQYVYDKSLFDASIVVEYKADGTITCVLYSERVNELSYGTSGKSISSLKSSADLRYDNIVGMYEP